MARPSSLLRSILMGSVIASSLALPACSGFLSRSGPSSLGIMPGIINDPANRSLRRSIMHFGLEEFCKELTHRGAPLHMREDDPTIGRFYARTCDFQELGNGDIFIKFAGVGYAWTNLSLRVGFEASGAIQYDQDFMMDGSTMYAYFRTRTIASTTFNALMVERGGTNGSAALSGFANPIAKQVVEKQLTRGFTVIRDTDGNVEFGVGVVEKGQHPPKPFAVSGKDRVTLINERTEIQGQQLDFLGPFEVDSDGRALYISASVDGVPAVDVFIVRKDTGDQWIDTFIRNPGLRAPSTPPLMFDVAQTRTTWQKFLPLAKGYYYVVVDNSSTIGNVVPPKSGSIPLLSGAFAAPDAAANVSVAIQMGDAP